MRRRPKLLSTVEAPPVSSDDERRGRSFVDTTFYAPSSSDDEEGSLIRPAALAMRLELARDLHSDDEQRRREGESEESTSSDDSVVSSESSSEGERRERRRERRRAKMRARAPRQKCGCRHGTFGLCSVISAVLIAYVAFVMRAPEATVQDRIVRNFFGKIGRDIKGMGDKELWNTLATELTLMYTQQKREILGLPRKSLAKLAEIQLNSGAYQYLLANDIICACDKPSADTIKNAILIDLEMETGVPVVEMQLLDSRQIDEKALIQLRVPFAHTLPRKGDEHKKIDLKPIVELVHAIQTAIDKGEYAHKMVHKTPEQLLAERMAQRGG